jgi:twinkle protein
MDPYNYIEHVVPPNYTETQYISEVLTKIKRFCITNMVHTILVAHPTKIKKVEGKYEVPTLYSIAGSAHFFNKADNGLVVYRDYDTNEVEVYIQKIRNRFTGMLGAVDFAYNYKSGTYSEVSEFI